ncbi:MAG: hypothetical protein IMF08_14780 [Proteobacteria bacterium]|nr:hypothetical protein [Pseudomonadota bacterium]
MAETNEKLPACYFCEYDDRGFPCRNDDGTLNMDRLAKASLVICQEKSGTPLYKENFWSSFCEKEIVREAPETAFQFIVYALPMFKTNREIAVLAAGPLEDLVVAHGEQMIDAIELEASKNERFRILLSGIWGEARTNPEVWRRIQVAVGDGPHIDDDHRTPQGSRKSDSGA